MTATPAPVSRFTPSLRAWTLRAPILALAVLACPATALARHPEVIAELGTAERLGEARYHVLAWPVFDAELWAREDAFSWDRPFALSLTYRREISANDLVSRSLSGVAERARLESNDRLATLLRSCFANVQPNDRFTGVSLNQDLARFYLNGRQTCEITWPGFRRAFFGIWLDAPGRDRALSARLTGARRAPARRAY